MSYFIHFFGADGTGKTTQARMLANHLKENGADVKVVRIRSGRTLASVLYSLLEHIAPNVVEHGGDGRVICIDSVRGRFHQQIWGLIEFVGMVPWLIWGVHIPLAVGKTVVAERYIVDAIATIAFLINDPSWPRSFLARLLLKFIPRNCLFIHIDAPYRTITKRRGNLTDPVEYIEFQRKVYDVFARVLSAVTIDTSKISIEETHHSISQHFKGDKNASIDTIGRELGETVEP